MLSHNDKAVKRSYVHYTDPDNAADQVVDFSKRYPENDPEEVRRTSAKNSQLSLTTMNCEELKSDELKFFCDEGTPGMASFASSCNDLREVGINKPGSEALISEEQKSKECCFTSPPEFSVDITNSNKNCIDSNLVADEAEKRESNNEEEYINLEATKASSPMMFSRSSSICSLNSFGQHSIVDDRSSVSAFSNLASGLISPSEIPDSPCGVESPFISKSKTNEFIFPSNDKSVDPVLVDQTILHEDFPDEAFGDLVDDVKVYQDEGDCSSVSNLSALSIQADSSLHRLSLAASVTPNKNQIISLNLTQKLSVTVNYLVPDEETGFIDKCQNLKVVDESYISEQDCINTKSGVPSDIKDSNQSEKSQSTIETKYEDKGTSTSEDFNFHDHSCKWTSFPLKEMEKLISVSMEERQSLKQNGNKQLNKESERIQWIVKGFKELMAIEGCNIETFLQKNKSPNYSKDISEDESDGILEECVLSEMPSKESSIFNDSKQSLKHSFQRNGSPLKDDMPTCSLSDNGISDDDDDDDDGILNECVLLGMPQKSSSLLIEIEKNSVLDTASYNSAIASKSSVSDGPNHQLNIFEDTYQSTMQDDIKDLIKSDDDSDIDESDLLVQQCIQLGRSELRNPKSPKLSVIPQSNKALGSRDNWPDGVSDGEDDDDDILSEIIKAGKPVPNSQGNKLSLSGANSCLKSENPRKLTAAEDRESYLNKDYYENTPKEIVQTACASANALIGIDDSMCVYRTEDTPILSPSASLSDLSTLSFTEEKLCQDSFLNNSRNSDCSSDSEDDEMLLQCIRQGMPGGKRLVV